MVLGLGLRVGVRFNSDFFSPPADDMSSYSLPDIFFRAFWRDDMYAFLLQFFQLNSNITLESKKIPYSSLSQANLKISQIRENSRNFSSFSEINMGPMFEIP